MELTKMAFRFARAYVRALIANVRCGVSADLTRNPVDGFSAGLVDDTNIFEWAVTVIGPPDTL